MDIYQLTKGAEFDPETLQAVYCAFEEVCAKFEELGLMNKENDRLLELAARQIIEDARAGERRPAVMRNSALRILSNALRNSVA